ncbi:hypothetical protein BG003_000744, partial [Podila horticola]
CQACWNEVTYCIKPRQEVSARHGQSSSSGQSPSRQGSNQEQRRVTVVEAGAYRFHCGLHREESLSSVIDLTDTL